MPGSHALYSGVQAARAPRIPHSEAPCTWSNPPFGHLGVLSNFGAMFAFSVSMSPARLAAGPAPE